jgi:hypothetical protein
VVTGPALAVTDDQLVQEYLADKNAASRKYSGKLLEITGAVQKSFISALDVPVVVLHETDPKKPLATVMCFFSAQDEDRTLPLSKTQSVKIRGVLEDSTAPLLRVGQCQLVEAKENPALALTAAQLAKEFAADQGGAAKKYDKKPLVVEGVVAEAGKDQDSFKLFLAGSNEGAATPLRVRVYVATWGSEVVGKRLAQLKPGQAIRVRGLGSLYEGATEVAVTEAALLSR